MSMTTERRGWRRLSAALVTLSLLLAGWTAVAATAARLGGFDSLLVVAPPRGFLERLPTDIAVTDGGRHHLVLRADRSDHAEALYAAGAMLVLPARRAGCLAILEGRKELPSSL